MPDPCLSCAYLAGEAERWRVLAEVNARLADARAAQIRALQAEVEILRQQNAGLVERVAVQAELLTRRAERN